MARLIKMPDADVVENETSSDHGRRKSSDDAIKSIDLPVRILCPACRVQMICTV